MSLNANKLLFLSAKQSAGSNSNCGNEVWGFHNIGNELASTPSCTKQLLSLPSGQAASANATNFQEFSSENKNFQSHASPPTNQKQESTGILSPNLEFSASRRNIANQQLKNQTEASHFRVSTAINQVSSDIGEANETGIENISVCLTEKKCQNRLNSTASSGFKPSDLMLSENADPASFLK